METELSTEVGRRQVAGSLELAVVDYGMGNLMSVVQAFRRLGCAAKVAINGRALRDADAIILPGVGGFGDAIKALRSRGLVEPLSEAVLEKRTTFLGICLGMQLIAERSAEHGNHRGLGWIDATVEYLPTSVGRCPHVGWTHVSFDETNPLFHNIEPAAAYYFDHSLHFVVREDIDAATFSYGSQFVAAISRNNIHATQFHPEKSERAGLRVLRNFLNICLDRREAACG